jgi:hypothetical protein
MNKPHPRSPTVIRSPHLGSSRTIQEQALERRHELDAQQRAYREEEAAREAPRARPRCPG